MYQCSSSVNLAVAICLVAMCQLTLSAPASMAAPLSSESVSMQKGEIAIDNPLCLNATKSVLEDENNNAVDAAVAALLCLGVVNFHTSGIGGSMVMVVAKKDPMANGALSVTVIDARGVAPLSVDRGDMYTDDLKQYGKVAAHMIVN